MPVLPPTTSGAPSGPRNAPLTRRAVPFSTVSTRATRSVRATSGRITRSPVISSSVITVSKGVPSANLKRSKRPVGSRMPSLTMMPMRSASAAGRSPELPIEEA